MHSTLLRAKLPRPASNAGAIARPRLIGRLHDGLGYKAILVEVFEKAKLLAS